MADIIRTWKTAYREAPIMARMQILYMVVGIPVLMVGAVIHMSRFL